MTKLNKQVVGIGIVGGGFGGYGLTPAFRRNPRCQVAAIATSSPESAEKAAEKYDIPDYCTWPELVASDEIDALAIAVPPSLQSDIATAALRAGKPVFAEKPLAINLDEAGRLADLAADSGAANMIDFIFPELETWREARALVDSDRLGNIRHVFLDWRMESFDIRTNKVGWKTDSESGGGVLSHFGAHCFYYLENFFGPISELGASTHKYPGATGSGETLANLTLLFSSGATCSVSLCSAAPHGIGHRLEIYGDKGSIRLFNESSVPVLGFKLLFRSKTETEWSPVHEENQLEGNEHDDSRVSPVAELTDRFVNWILEDKPARPNFRDGYRTQFLLSEAYRSSRELGRRINVLPKPA